MIYETRGCYKVESRHGTTEHTHHEIWNIIWRKLAHTKERIFLFMKLSRNRGFAAGLTKVLRVKGGLSDGLYVPLESFHALLPYFLIQIGFEEEVAAPNYSWDFNFVRAFGESGGE